MVLDYRISNSFFNETLLLTKRQVDIVYYLSLGYSTEEIADELSISSNTVSTHRKHMIRKLKAKNTVHLVSYARELMLI